MKNSSNRKNKARTGLRGRLTGCGVLAVIALVLCLPGRGQGPMNLTSDQKLRMASAIINQYYVEEVNGDTLTQEAIKAMLKTLDPHSSYSTPEETKELTQPLEGKFSGIGVQFNMGTDTVYVIQTTIGGPSEKAGIIAGDRIISANDTIIAGRKLSQAKIFKALRGPKGSKVKLMVKRGNNPQLLEFNLIRDDIPLYSVSSSYMADPETGYISVTRFAEETPREVDEALAKLKAKGMKRVIIDLQNNGGGYLGAAVGLASLFMPKGTPVVYTKGLHSKPMYFNVEKPGRWQDLPLVVLLDQYSASASEIFAGAIQDNDRGLVAGRRSFGKGLVQRPFPFPDGSMIRLTVAKYYTPSGRLVQKPYEKGRGEEYYLDLLTRYNSGELWTPDSIHVADSLAYFTLNNSRTVYGGGGILPDLFVPADTTYYSDYYRDMVAKGSLNRYVLSTLDKNRKSLLEKYPDEDLFMEKFEVTPDMERELIAFAGADSVKYNEKSWKRSQPMIRAILKGLIMSDMYKNGNYSRAVNPLNPVYTRALGLINNPRLYYNLLKGVPDNRIPAKDRKNYLLLPASFRK